MAIGAIMAVRAEIASPLIAVPAVVFGVVAATSPALYIATAVTGAAPPLGAVVRAFSVALGAFGIALAGLLLPAAFLALSSTDPLMTFLAATAAVGAAAFLGLRRLAHELVSAGKEPYPGATDIKPSLTSSTVFFVWSAATIGIAGRLWWDLAKEVLS
ncbi:MAG: hypothetical protein H0T42_05400 [Deltaproteobacteria bacterium]|nr:hypothetical protein [Deltaproteobacteria bacterium]